MINSKQISRVAATLSVAVAVIIGFSVPAEGAIVGGTVKGTWEGAFGGLNAGDSFTASYTYDELALESFTLMTSPRTSASVVEVPLLSLVVESGSIREAFDFDPRFENTIRWYYERTLPGSISIRPLISINSVFLRVFGANTVFDAFAFSGIGPIEPDFNEAGPVSGSSVEFRIYRPGEVESGGFASSGVRFSQPLPPDPIPTPALLPGLVGMGLAAFQKRKNAATDPSGGTENRELHNVG